MYRQQRTHRIDTRRISRLAPAARRKAFDSRSGFTLVEMLVSVALVVIMMSMFATVFQLAAGSMGTQRGIAENDQRARSVVTVIQNDLKNRSFRVLTPFDTGEDEPNPSVVTPEELAVRDFAKREGFFYISENDLNDDSDDVLHFTVRLDGTTRDTYFGKAAALYPLSTNTPPTSFLASNEPDRDDNIPVPDGSSDSVAAEIAIFMRGGRLYRRVLLIRDPPSSFTPTDQPNDSGIDYFDDDNDGDTTVGPPTIPEPYADIALYNTAATGNFWNDFDFSAHFGASSYAEFHSLLDLDNRASAGGLFPLGKPRNRFGHSHADGLPREYFNNSGGFMGRFTHEETSNSAFLYPQAGSTAVTGGNPMDQAVALTDATNDAVIDEFANGPRRAEDLLLPNVHAFDIKVWDEVMQQFLDVGHNEFIDVGNDGSYDSGTDTYGDYNQNRNQNTFYGPNGTDLSGNPIGNRVFDTWHRASGINVIDNSTGTTPADSLDDPPPFLPVGGTPSIPKPLKAIQITIRYLDVSSNQLRQVTQQISLVD